MRKPEFDLKEMAVAVPADGPDSFEAEERVIIALDFGTTFSGIAYCFPNQHNAKVATVVNWPGWFPEHSPFTHVVMICLHMSRLTYAVATRYRWGIP